ncbi:uncharacterized protein LOC142767832 [Rhipicephalus microplus]|uniref:uncharacterized protein LOC142767832 n=1 Tax=Rhipicephalus microplus TaxID=6941 RepID=UPI003F6C1205
MEEKHSGAHLPFFERDHVGYGYVPLQAKSYDPGQSDHSLQLTVIRQVFNMAFSTPSNESQQFLDIGCGTGDFTLECILPTCQPCRRQAMHCIPRFLPNATAHPLHVIFSYECFAISGSTLGTCVVHHASTIYLNTVKRKTFAQYVIKSYREVIVAIDYSESMLKHARENHSSEKILYEYLDINNDVLGFLKKYGTFQWVYSFKTLQWSQDLRCALSNIADLLLPGGECLLYFYARNFLKESFKHLSRMKRWSKYADVSA